MADDTKPQAEVHIYTKNEKAPQYIYQADLKGWDADRLDLEFTLKKYKLKEVYAYSLDRGRGLQLVPNRKNGLSLTTYTGKKGSIVRIFGVPQRSLLKSSITAAFLVIFGLTFLALVQNHNPNIWEVAQKWASNYEGWPVMFAGVLILIYYVGGKRLSSWYR
eukprot:jgi/Mesen1/5153/ME000255S04123